MVGYRHLEFRRMVWTGETHLGVLDLEIIFRLSLDKVFKRISVDRGKIPALRGSEKRRIGHEKIERE